MEAGPFARRVFVLGGLLWSLGSLPLNAADFRTQNFIVSSASPRLAKEVAQAAEEYRRDLAMHWLGKPLRAWRSPCPIRVVAGPNLAAQGVTQYDRAPVRNFTMEVVGTPERILDSVLPHEVTHTVLATHFGRPLPRWADEGICTTVEHESEKAKHEAKLREFLRTRRGIAMNDLFLLTEYPADVLPMYAQGYSVCRFLIEQEGPRQFIQFLHDYMRDHSWTQNVKKHYGYGSLRELQEYWLAWVTAGSGPVERYTKRNGGEPSGRNVAAADPPRMALASTSSDSFYLRRRDNPNARRADASTAPDAGRRGRGNPGRDSGSSSSSPENSSLAAEAQPRPARSEETSPQFPLPPSVKNSGRYSAAQPQPEQGGRRPPTAARRSGRYLGWR